MQESCEVLPDKGAAGGAEKAGFLTKEQLTQQSDVAAPRNRSHKQLCALDRLVASGLTYAGWHADVKQAECCHVKFPSAFDGFLAKISNKEALQTGDRSHGQLRALDAQLASGLTYARWQSDVERAELLHVEHPSAFDGFLANMTNKQAMHTGDRSHEQLRALDALVASGLTYPGWHADVKRAERCHAGYTSGFPRASPRLMNTASSSFDSLLVEMQKLQAMHTGDRSHPQLRALDALVASGLGYPGWQADVKRAELYHVESPQAFDEALAKVAFGAQWDREKSKKSGSAAVPSQPDPSERAWMDSDDGEQEDRSARKKLRGAGASEEAEAGGVRDGEGRGQGRDWEEGKREPEEEQEERRLKDSALCRLLLRVFWMRRAEAAEARCRELEARCQCSQLETASSSVTGPKCVAARAVPQMACTTPPPAAPSQPCQDEPAPGEPQTPALVQLGGEMDQHLSRKRTAGWTTADDGDPEGRLVRRKLLEAGAAGGAETGAGRDSDKRGQGRNWEEGTREEEEEEEEECQLKEDSLHQRRLALFKYGWMRRAETAEALCRELEERAAQEEALPVARDGASRSDLEEQGRLLETQQAPISSPSSVSPPERSEHCQTLLQLAPRLSFKFNLPLLQPRRRSEERGVGLAEAEAKLEQRGGQLEGREQAKMERKITKEMLVFFRQHTGDRSEVTLRMVKTAVGQQFEDWDAVLEANKAHIKAEAWRLAREPPSSICVHNRTRRQCKECGVSQICKHIDADQEGKSPVAPKPCNPTSAPAVETGRRLEEREARLKERETEVQALAATLAERGVKLEEKGRELEESKGKVEERAGQLEEREAATLAETGHRLEEREARLEAGEARLEERASRLEAREAALQEGAAEQPLGGLVQSIMLQRAQLPEPLTPIPAALGGGMGGTMGGPAPAMSGHMCGVGITFEQAIEQGSGLARVSIKRIRPGSSAAQSCSPSLGVGDTVISVNGKSVYGKPLSFLRTLIPGPLNSIVQLGFETESGAQKNVALVRMTTREHDCPSNPVEAHPQIPLPTPFRKQSVHCQTLLQLAPRLSFKFNLPRLQPRRRSEERGVELAEAEAKLEQRGGQLEGREATLEEREAKLEKRGRQLEEREVATLAETGRRLEEREARLKERETEVQALAATLAERGVKLEEKGRELEESKGKVEERAGQLEEREAATLTETKLHVRGLEERGTRLKEREAEVQALAATLEERGVKLEEKGRELEERGAETRRQLKRAQEELERLRPEQVDLTEEDEGGETLGQARQGGSGGQDGGSGGGGELGGGGGGAREASGMALLAHAQRRTLQVKRERDEEEEEKEEAHTAFALFIDRQHTQIDALRALCTARGIPAPDVNAALRFEPRP